MSASRFAGREEPASDQAFGEVSKRDVRATTDTRAGKEIPLMDAGVGMGPVINPSFCRPAALRALYEVMSGEGNGQRKGERKAPGQDPCMGEGRGIACGGDGDGYDGAA